MPPTRLGVGLGVRVGQTYPYAVPVPVPVPLPLPLPLATNQTAGRSPFIATSSLAELYRRSVTPPISPLYLLTSPLNPAELYRRSVTPLYLPCISSHLP